MDDVSWKISISGIENRERARELSRIVREALDDAENQFIRVDIRGYITPDEE